MLERSAMPHTERILVVGPSWVGDMVMAQSLFMTLKAQHPEADIDVLAPAWSLPILSRMPEVRRGLVMPLGHGELNLGARWRLGRALARERYAHAIVLPGSLKSALVPWFAGIPRRTGFTGELRFGLINDRRTRDRQRLPMTVHQFVSLGLPQAFEQTPNVPPPRLQVRSAQDSGLLQRLGLPWPVSAVALMPGAEFGPSKQWPAAHFAELARTLVARGEHVWILGSARDLGMAKQIAQLTQAPTVHVLCGHTELVDTVDLLALCRAAVSNDSGLMHIAAAVGTPLVALYGSTDPGHTPPLNPKAQVLRLGLDCSPCFKRECPLGHQRCLQDLRPAQVLEALA